MKSPKISSSAPREENSRGVPVKLSLGAISYPHIPEAEHAFCQRKYEGADGSCICPVSTLKPPVQWPVATHKGRQSGHHPPAPVREQAVEGIGQ